MADVRVQHHERADRLAPRRVRDADDDDLADGGDVLGDGVLDEPRGDLDPTGVDDVVDPAVDVQPPVGTPWPTSSVRNQPSRNAAAVSSGCPR